MCIDKRRHIWTAALVVLVLVFAQCAVKLTADYNAEIAREIIEVAKMVDSFYGELLEMPYEDRSYDTYSETYRHIEVELRGLVMQNKIRPLNEESTSIADTILRLWIKYKDKHALQWQKYNLPEGNPDKISADEIYKDALARNHRIRFQRLFTAMAVAEEAKKMKGSDIEEEVEE